MTYICIDHIDRKYIQANPVSCWRISKAIFNLSSPAALYPGICSGEKQLTENWHLSFKVNFYLKSLLVFSVYRILIRRLLLTRNLFGLPVISEFLFLWSLISIHFGHPWTFQSKIRTNHIAFIFLINFYLILEYNWFAVWCFRCIAMWFSYTYIHSFSDSFPCGLLQNIE